MEEYEGPHPDVPPVGLPPAAPVNEPDEAAAEAPKFRPAHARLTPLRERLQDIDQDPTIPDEQKRHIKRELVLQEIARRATSRARSNKPR